MYSEDERIIGTFYDDENYKMEYEILDNKLFGHITVHKQGPTVMKHIKRNWVKALNKAKEEGYDNLFAYTQNVRFVEFLGGSLYLSNINYKGKEYEVHSWELK